MVNQDEDMGRPRGEPVIRSGTPPAPDDPYPSSQIIEEYPDGSVVVTSGPVTEKEIREYEDAIARFPGSAALRVHYARVLSGIGRPDDALQQVREAVRLDPGNWFGRSTLASLLQEAGDIAGALEEKRATLRLVTGDPAKADSQAHSVGRWGLAQLLLQAGCAEEARNEMQHAIELQQDLVRRQSGSPHLLAQLKRELAKFNES